MFEEPLQKLQGPGRNKAGKHISDMTEEGRTKFQQEEYEKRKEEESKKIREIWDRLKQSGIERLSHGRDYEVIFEFERGNFLVDMRYLHMSNPTSPLSDKISTLLVRKSVEEVVEMCRLITEIVKGQTDNQSPDDVFYDVKNLVKGKW